MRLNGKVCRGPQLLSPDHGLCRIRKNSSESEAMTVPRPCPNCKQLVWRQNRPLTQFVGSTATQAAELGAVHPHGTNSSGVWVVAGRSNA